MTPKEQTYKNLAASMMNKLEKRGFEATYAPTAADALEKAKSYIKPGMTYSTGGSVTLSEIGLMPALDAMGAKFIDYRSPKTQEEKDKANAAVTVCDCYFMSSNAITEDGILLNIDGNGNRLSAMMYGPKNVVIVIGMQKVCHDIESAYWRIKTVAAPSNAVRLSKKTPCGITGICTDCQSPECMCTYIVATRRSNPAGRIKIILCGEELGF